jgi:trehalose synthase
VSAARAPLRPVEVRVPAQPLARFAELVDPGVEAGWRAEIRHPLVEEGWEFLRPSLEHADAIVFSRQAYVPAFCRDGRVAIVRPAIDPFSPKNQELPPGVVRAILVRCGLVEGAGDGVVCGFNREDGSPGRVDRGADILRLGRAPDAGTPLVVQVSRWDRLKDHVGVMRGFVRLEEAQAAGAHLVLAGPSVTGVADDPEGPAVLAELTTAWRALPHASRRRVQIASLPMVDPGENAAMVNALQRHATVIVQKSLQEGFGLTVTEAMWKARPVVASAVGASSTRSTTGATGCSWTTPRTSTGSRPRRAACSAIRPRRVASGRRRVSACGPSRSASGCSPTTPV